MINVIARVIAPGGSKPKSCFDSVRELTRTNRSPLLEIARMLVRFDHVARFIVNPDHGVM